jgi:hypothetical protein
VFLDRRDPKQMAISHGYEPGESPDDLKKIICELIVQNEIQKSITTVGRKVRPHQLVEVAFQLCVPNGPYTKSQAARALGIGRATLYWPSKQARKDKQVAIAIEKWQKLNDTMESGPMCQDRKRSSSKSYSPPFPFRSRT